MNATTRILWDKPAADIPWDKLKRGTWGDGKKVVCAMSALVPGAQTETTCIAAGWPVWLPTLVICLYDANIGAAVASTPAAEQAEAAEQAAADAWFRQLVGAVSRPVDYEAALHRFLISTLEPIKHLAESSIPPIIEMHRQALGKDAPKPGDWIAAWDAARAARTSAGAGDAARADALSAARHAAIRAARNTVEVAALAAGNAAEPMPWSKTWSEAWSEAWTAAFVNARINLIQAIVASEQLAANTHSDLWDLRGEE